MLKTRYFVIPNSDVRWFNQRNFFSSERTNYKELIEYENTWRLLILYK